MIRGLRRKTTILEDSFFIENKGEFIMEQFRGTIEYKMPKEMADAYLKARKGEDKKMRPNDFLRKVVNQEFGLKGYCVNVITF